MEVATTPHVLDYVWLAKFLLHDQNLVGKILKEKRRDFSLCFLLIC